MKISIISPEKNRVEEELHRFVPESQADLIFFPENFMRSEEDFLLAKKLAKECKKWILSGRIRESNNGQKSESACLLTPDGEDIFYHDKTALTDGDRKNGYEQGTDFNIVDTPFGKIGVVICYEVHFPEIARILALKGAKLIFNPVGGGMYHDQQYMEWTTIARTRAIENMCYMFGTCHFTGEVPMQYAYKPDGRMLLERKHHYGETLLEIDETDLRDIGYFADRVPSLYKEISEL